MTEHADEHPPVRIPRRPSKRRRAQGNRRVHAEGAPTRPRGPETEREAQHEYATVDGARRKRLSFRAGLAVVMPVAEILSREPPTVAQCWEMHRHKARIWRPKPPPPPPKLKQPAPEQWAWDGDGCVLAPAAPAFIAAPQPSSWAVWAYRLSITWGLLHTVLLAAILLLTWITARAPRTLAAAGLIWIIFFVIW